MMRKTIVPLLVLACLAAPAAAKEAPEMTLEQVLEKHYEAVGGLEALEALESFEATGKMSMGPGMEAPFKMTLKRPEKLRIEFVVQGMTGVQAYDGETAWMVMPFAGSTTPEVMSADQAKMLEEQADIDGALVRWQEKGHQVELVGREEVEGTPVYKLKVTMASGDLRYHYLDSDYFLVIKQEGKATVQGQEIEFETTLSDYKEVDGLVFPHSIASKPKNAPQGQVITIEKITLNEEVADDIFSMPADQKKAAE